MPSEDPHPVRRARLLPEVVEMTLRPGAVIARALSVEPAWSSIVASYLGPLLAVSAFFAFSYAAAVTAGHLLVNLGLYLMVFATHGALAVLIARLAAGASPRRTLHVFALTYLPLELFFLLLLGVFVVSSEPYRAVFALARTWVLPIAFGLMLLWCGFLTYAAFRALCRGRPWLAAGCTVAYYGGFFGLVWLYIRVMDLLPLPWGR